MDVTLFGIVIEAKLEHSQKVPAPMVVTPLGIVMEVRLEQYSKALLPMDVTPPGIVMEVRLEQPEKGYPWLLNEFEAALREPSDSLLPSITLPPEAM